MAIYFTFNGKKCKHVPITGDRWSIVLKKKKKKKKRFDHNGSLLPFSLKRQTSNLEPQTLWLAERLTRTGWR